ncbi:MAG: hypothetical protein ACTSQ8_10840 [Candidatus Helarchaeota archaeon]
MSPHTIYTWALFFILGAISQVCPTKRRAKKKSSNKLLKKSKSSLDQPPLEVCSPRTDRKPEARKWCLVLTTSSNTKSPLGSESAANSNLPHYPS